MVSSIVSSEFSWCIRGFGCKSFKSRRAILRFASLVSHVALVHANRFDLRAALQAFQTRDLFALFDDGLLQCADVAEQSYQQRFKLWPA